MEQKCRVIHILFHKTSEMYTIFYLQRRKLKVPPRLASSPTSLVVLAGHQHRIKDESGSEFHLIAIAANHQNDMLEGTVLEVTTEELSVADTYEPEDYKRVKATLQSGKSAWLYAAAKGVK